MVFRGLVHEARMQQRQFGHGGVSVFTSGPFSSSFGCLFHNHSNVYPTRYKSYK